MVNHLDMQELMVEVQSLRSDVRELAMLRGMSDFCWSADKRHKATILLERLKTGTCRG